MYYIQLIFLSQIFILLLIIYKMVIILCEDDLNEILMEISMGNLPVFVQI